MVRKNPKLLCIDMLCENSSKLDKLQLTQLNHKKMINPWTRCNFCTFPSPRTCISPFWLRHHTPILKITRENKQKHFSSIVFQNSGRSPPLPVPCSAFTQHTPNGCSKFKIRPRSLPRLDDSRHVVAGVVPVAAALAEEQDARDEGKDDAGRSDEERPVEHHSVVVKAHIMILVHESAIDTDANSHTDSCNMPTQQVNKLLPTVLFITVLDIKKTHRHGHHHHYHLHFCVSK